MNRIKAIIYTLVAFTAGSVYAEDYNIGWSNADPSNAFLLNGGNGGNTLTTIRDASLSFAVQSTTRASVPLSFTVYTYDAATKSILSSTTFDSLSLGDTFSVNLNAGDNVGFIFNDGTVTSNTMSPNSQYYYGSLQDPQNFQFKFHVDDQDWSNYWSTIISMTPGAAVPAPAGAPLPGAALTGILGLLVGCSIIGLRRFRASRA